GPSSLIHTRRNDRENCSWALVGHSWAVVEVAPACCADRTVGRAHKSDEPFSHTDSHTSMRRFVTVLQPYVRFGSKADIGGRASGCPLYFQQQTLGISFAANLYSKPVKLANGPLA